MRKRPASGKPSAGREASHGKPSAGREARHGKPSAGREAGHLSARQTDPNHTVLSAGMAETRAALREWRPAPWPVVRTWAAGSLVIALTLLAATLVVAALSRPSGRPGDIVPVAGIFDSATAGDMVHVFLRNLTVLTLHALACVAGYLARRSLPMQADLRHGVDRWVHEHAGGVALGFVLGATLFSLVVQAYALGHATRDTAAVGSWPPPLLLLCLLPHALPELTAVFLPFAAFLMACWRHQYQHLLAATVITSAVALPILVATAAVETYVSPAIVRGLLGLP